MAEYDSKILNGAGLSAVVNDYITRLATKYGQSEVQNAITTALANYYKKTETYSKTEVETLINNLNSVKILNKSSVNSGIIESTTANVDTTCDAYIQTNYSRSPADNDGLLVTITDNNDDIVLYIYTTASASWIDISRQFSFNVSNATDTIAGIVKLYNALGSQTDGAVTPNAVNAKVTSIESSIGTINTTLGNKANSSTVTALQQTVSSLETEVDGKAESATTLAGYGITDAYTKTQTYAKTETYSRTEVDNKIPQALTPTEIDQIIESVVGA